MGISETLASFHHSFIPIPAVDEVALHVQHLRELQYKMPPVDKTVAAQFETLPVPLKLLTAGASACFADFASFPLDTAKVRLQVGVSYHILLQKPKL